MFRQRMFRKDTLNGGTVAVTKLFTFAGSSVGRGEAHQGDVIRKILQHCGLWHDPPPRAPPRQTRPSHEIGGGITYEANPDFLEHTRREVFSSRQEQLLWDD